MIIPKAEEVLYLGNFVGMETVDGQVYEGVEVLSQQKTKQEENQATCKRSLIGSRTLSSSGNSPGHAAFFGKKGAHGALVQGNQC